MADKSYAGSIAQVPVDYASAYQAKKRTQLELDTETFLQLIVAQIQNQDVLGMGDSGGSSNSSGDYVNQLLQMTLVQSISDMMDMSTTSYAMSMVGKEVTVAKIDGTNVEAVTGVVSGVSLYGDEPILHVNGEQYKLSQVMTVGSTEAKTDKTEALLEEILKELRKEDGSEEEETTPPSTDGSGETPPSTDGDGGETTPPSTDGSGSETTPPSTGGSGGSETPPPSTDGSDGNDDGDGA